MLVAAAKGAKNSRSSTVAVDPKTVIGPRDLGPTHAIIRSWLPDLVSIIRNENVGFFAFAVHLHALVVQRGIRKILRKLGKSRLAEDENGWHTPILPAGEVHL